jgi:hypothetical protein
LLIGYSMLLGMKKADNWTSLGTAVRDLLAKAGITDGKISVAPVLNRADQGRKKPEAEAPGSLPTGGCAGVLKGVPGSRLREEGGCGHRVRAAGVIRSDMNFKCVAPLPRGEGAIAPPHAQGPLAFHESSPFSLAKLSKISSGLGNCLWETAHPCCAATSRRW